MVDILSIFILIFLYFSFVFLSIPEVSHVQYETWQNYVPKLLPRIIESFKFQASSFKIQVSML